MNDTIHARLDVVAQRPGAPAFADVTGVLATHGDLRRIRDGWRQRLRERGVRRRDRVALVMSGGWWMGAILAATSGAAIAAPLDTGLTDRELGDYLALLEPSLVVADPVTEHRVRALTRTGVLVAEPGLADGAPDGELPQPGDLALLLLTSGTTTRPKLVQLTHGNVFAAGTSVAGTMELTAADRALNLMPLHHGHGLFAGLLGPLLSGGSTVCDRLRDAEALEAVARSARPTWYSAAPVVHHSVLAAIRTTPRILSVLRPRAVRSISSALPPRLLGQLEDAFGVPVIEAYGLTESPGQIASNPLRGVRKPGTVGLPANTEIVLRTPHGLTSDPGVVGEVLVRGPNLMAGYAGLPADAQPFHEGYLRTGDQGRFDEDGYLTILGRAGDVISRGAEKVSAAEVEAVLLEHPGVRDAAVHGRTHRILGQEVAAKIIRSGEAEVTEDELLAFAAGRLASFKVPVTVEFVEDLPRNGLGKLRRELLGDEERAAR
jgi:acyl-CoA synthetase (AMP-forming)/AMP-acid ligase II